MAVFLSCVARRVSLDEQALPTLSEHSSSLQDSVECVLLKIWFSVFSRSVIALLSIVVSVLLRFKVFDYPLKPSKSYNYIEFTYPVRFYDPNTLFDL